MEGGTDADGVGDDSEEAAERGRQRRSASYIIMCILLLTPPGDGAREAECRLFKV